MNITLQHAITVFFYKMGHLFLYTTILMYSKHLRIASIKAYYLFSSFRKASTIFNISKTTLHRWVNGWKPKSYTKTNYIIYYKFIKNIILHSILIHKEKKKVIECINRDVNAVRNFKTIIKYYLAKWL